MKELQLIQKDLKSPKGLFNTFGNFNYRSAEDILKALKPLLDEQKCILTLSDSIEHIGDRFYIKATACLTNSQTSICVSAYAREAAEMKGMNPAQVTGAASSYARKYALNGLFAIDNTADPDSMDNTADPKPAKTQPAKPKILCLDEVLDLVRHTKSREELEPIHKQYSLRFGKDKKEQSWEYLKLIDFKVEEFKKSKTLL